MSHRKGRQKKGCAKLNLKSYFPFRRRMRVIYVAAKKDKFRAKVGK